MRIGLLIKRCRNASSLKIIEISFEKKNPKHYSEKMCSHFLECYLQIQVFNSAFWYSKDKFLRKTYIFLKKEKNHTKTKNASVIRVEI